MGSNTRDPFKTFIESRMDELHTIINQLQSVPLGSAHETEQRDLVSTFMEHPESSFLAKRGLVERDPFVSVCLPWINSMFRALQWFGGWRPVAAYRVAECSHVISQDQSKCSAGRVIDQMKHTGAAAAVLYRSLCSVLTSANQGVRSGFELRVASLLADIAAANESRRTAIVSAGGGKVVDWLLETVSLSGNGNGERGRTQAEAARALAHLVADPDVCERVLARPGAVPSLLKFIFSFQPKRPNQNVKHYSSLDGSDSSKGRSMLVTALMDIITSNCDTTNVSSLHPVLSPDADTRDILSAIEVIEQGIMQLDPHENDNDNDSDGDIGMKGIGIKVLGGTTILGFSPLENDEITKIPLSNNNLSNNLINGLNNGGTVPGLWDDLQREQVAVPFATWALANWATASNKNRLKIQELDSDGQAVLTALTASERSVKWHGCLTAKYLLNDLGLELSDDSVKDWGSSLLRTAFDASKNDDVALVQLAVSAFLVSVERCEESKKNVRERGLELMRGIVKRTERNIDVHEMLVRVLCLLYENNKDGSLSVEEGQKWSGILLRWIFDKYYTNDIRNMSINILENVLEDCGPACIPVSQGWLNLLLNEIIESNKKNNKNNNNNNLKGSSNNNNSALPQTYKVKTQIDYLNTSQATQISAQLTSSIVRQSSNRIPSEKLGNGIPQEPGIEFPLSDFLTLEPFSTFLKNSKNKTQLKLDAADSALASLKAIKALAELCSDDLTSQKNISDLGTLFLLKRFLLKDDYEKLAANETYDASNKSKNNNNDENNNNNIENNNNDNFSIRVPQAGHIRRHAARLLNIISILPINKNIIKSDEKLLKWLQNCATGRLQSDDLKLQSYCRSILLNINTESNNSNNSTNSNDTKKPPTFGDGLFFLNPENYENTPENYENAPEKGEYGDNNVKWDVVFVHGLRGGPFNSWRIADDKSSSVDKSGLVEKIDQEAGKRGTCWPREWLTTEFALGRFLTVKYKTNLTQWTGASLPLQEVSSMLLRRLLAAGIGTQPVVFVTHSMGGLVVKQMLYQAKLNNFDDLLHNTLGIVFYSCPHFGSKLADMPWRTGLVFRPAPSIGELRSGSPRLVELNEFIRHLYTKGSIDVLSFSETQVTPIVEGYGGWALRMEIVPIESAYPGFGELVVLASTDHVNSCKPVNKSDPSYAETLEFLKKLKARINNNNNS